MKVCSMVMLGLSVLAMAEEPTDAVRSFLDAVEAGDGYRAVCYLSDEAILHAGEIQQQMLTAGQGAALSIMMIGMDATPEELQAWDPVDFTAHLLTSDLITEMLAEAEVIDVEETGATSAQVDVMTTAPVTGADQPIGLPTVIEGDRWKLADIQGILLVISI